MCHQSPIDKTVVPSMYDGEGIRTIPVRTSLFPAVVMHIVETITHHRQVPGRRCPACLERGDTVWVIPGKCCPVCGTPVN
jgi:hypothetical protein